MKLFRAWSGVDNFSGHDRVTLSCFVADREGPVAPYEEIIKDYEDYVPQAEADDPFESMKHAQAVVDELFTEEEINQLRGYLREIHDEELWAEEVEVPIVAREWWPVGASPCGGSTDIYMLHREEGYSLPFKVSFFYDLRGCPKTIYLVPEAKSAGIEFAEAVLEEFGRSDVELSELVGRVYDELGLYVKRGDTAKERLAKAWEDAESRRSEEVIEIPF